MKEKFLLGKWVTFAPNYLKSVQLNWDRSLLMRNALNLFAWVFIFVVLYSASIHSYLLFHSFAELLAIIIASGVFIFSWNTRSYQGNNYLRFIGISFLFIAVLDAFHMLTYDGMVVFASQSTNLATQLWIAARYLQAFTFLTATLFFARSVNSAYVIAGYAALTILLLASIFYWQIFPVTYIEGSGLTPFKINSEYLISTLLIASALLLLLNAKVFQLKVLLLLTGSILFTVASELIFTLYIDVYDIFIFLGHFFKICAYYLLYRAILVTGLVEPYKLIFRNLKESQKELWQSMMQLQARNDELDAFAQTVAHDLKNPIAAINISLKTLDDPNFPEDCRQSFMRDLRDTTIKMNNIIESLLLLSTVRKSKVPIVELDMAQIVSSVMFRLNNLIKESQAEISVPENWPVALGYPQWIEEVWVNYLSNALEYGGSPALIELGAGELKGDQVSFWVKDHGPGIPEENLDQLFVEFTQLKNIHQNGNGLGLSIVERIIHRLGGEVGVESKLGLGSKFYFTLPTPS